MDKVELKIIVSFSKKFKGKGAMESSAAVLHTQSFDGHEMGLISVMGSRAGETKPSNCSRKWETVDLRLP